MLPKLGGMLRYGIPNYRLPKDRLDEDINAILKTGVEVKHGLKIGVDVTIQELREQYDAVLITIGASTDKKLGLEGEDCGRRILSGSVPAQCWEGTDPGSDRQAGGSHRRRKCFYGRGPHGEAAGRLQGKHCIPAGRVADMTALPGEIEGAVAVGIELQTLKAPAALDVDENHHIKGIYVTPQMVSAIKDGRASIKPTGEEDVYIPL